MASTVLFKISEEIRQPDEQHPQQCKFGQIPNEILHMIVTNARLTIFDRICLMLSCKKFANVVVKAVGDLKLKQTIESGREKERIEDLQWESWEVIDSDSEIDRERHREIRRLRAKTSMDKIKDFFHRLDYGWNRRPSVRFCYECGKFQNTTEQFWAEKGQKYEFTMIGGVARIWRGMKDCQCACDPQAFVDAWTTYGEKRLTKRRINKKIACPDCMLRRLPGFDKDGELTCGCPGCRCLIQ